VPALSAEVRTVRRIVALLHDSARASNDRARSRIVQRNPFRNRRTHLSSRDVQVIAAVPDASEEFRSVPPMTLFAAEAAPFFAAVTATAATAASPASTTSSGTRSKPVVVDSVGEKPGRVGGCSALGTAAFAGVACTSPAATIILAVKQAGPSGAAEL
jgi:hypothetical protein